jgi:hypothetical protein
MKINSAIIAMTGLALVAGCNRGATNASANASTTNNSAAAAPAAAPAGAGAPVDRTFLVGSWGNGGDCSRTLSFNADGTVTNSSDPEVARWTLEGETLTVTPPNQPPQPGKAVRGGDNLMLTSPDGQAATLTRCAAPAAAPAANASAEKEEAPE